MVRILREVARKPIIINKGNGGQGRNRTTDTRIFSREIAALEAALEASKGCPLGMNDVPRASWYRGEL